MKSKIVRRKAEADERTFLNLAQDGLSAIQLDFCDIQSQSKALRCGGEPAAEQFLSFGEKPICEILEAKAGLLIKLVVSISISRDFLRNKRVSSVFSVGSLLSGEFDLLSELKLFIGSTLS